MKGKSWIRNFRVRFFFLRRIFPIFFLWLGMDLYLLKITTIWPQSRRAGEANCLGPKIRLIRVRPANWFRILVILWKKYGFSNFLFRHARGAVRVLKTLRKHHKWKDNKFLHRSYTPKKFSTPTKNIFSSSIKIFFDFFRAFWVLVRVSL